MYVYLYVCMYSKYIEDRAWILNAEWIRRELSYSTPSRVLASLPRSGNVYIEVCTVRHFRIDRSVFPSHGVGAVHRRCQLLRSGEDDPRILYAPPNSPWTCCIFPGILVLMDFVLLSGLLVYAFGSKITPPKNKEVVIGKVEVQGCCGSDCSMRCFPRRLMCSAASLTNPLRPFPVFPKRCSFCVFFCPQKCFASHIRQNVFYLSQKEHVPSAQNPSPLYPFWVRCLRPVFIFSYFGG